MYIPPHALISEDQSRYYEKTPQEMSRHEIAELELMVKKMEEKREKEGEGAGDEIDEEPVDENSEEYLDFKKQMKDLQPIRHGVIKKYWDKYKYKKSKRELLMESLKETEE